MFWSQLLFCGMCILVVEDPTSPPFYIGRDEHTSAFSWSQASATALSAIPHVLSSSGGGGKSYRPFSHQLVAIAMLLLRLYNRETNLSGFFVVSPTLLFFFPPLVPCWWRQLVHFVAAASSFNWCCTYHCLQLIDYYYILLYIFFNDAIIFLFLTTDTKIFSSLSHSLSLLLCINQNTSFSSLTYHISLFFLFSLPKQSVLLLPSFCIYFI